jgi:hypothetical protein
MHIFLAVRKIKEEAGHESIKGQHLLSYLSLVTCKKIQHPAAKTVEVPASFEYQSASFRLHSDLVGSLTFC